MSSRLIIFLFFFLYNQNWKSPMALHHSTGRKEKLVRELQNFHLRKRNPDIDLLSSDSCFMFLLWLWHAFMVETDDLWLAAATGHNFISHVTLVKASFFILLHIIPRVSFSPASELPTFNEIWKRKCRRRWGGSGSSLTSRAMTTSCSSSTTSTQKSLFILPTLLLLSVRSLPVCTSCMIRENRDGLQTVSNEVPFSCMCTDVPCHRMRPSVTPCDSPDRCF